MNNRKKAGILFLWLTLFVCLTDPATALNVQKQGHNKVFSIARVKAENNQTFVPEMLGDTVTLAGRAAVSSGVLIKSHLLISIQDSTGGVMIFRRNYKGPVIKAGDSLRITGIVRLYSGHVEINPLQIDFVDTLNRRVPQPIKLSSKIPHKFYEGKLVETKAIVIDKSGNTAGKYLVVSEAKGSDSTMMVFVQNQAKNPRLLDRFSVGEVVKITGLFMRYEADNDEAGQYQIAPRSEKDLVLLNYSPARYLTILGIVLGIVLLSVLLNFLLRRQVVVRTKELQHAKEKAEESDRLKTAFLANMSHEIRTPMNGILGFAELLKDSDITREEKSSYIDVIQQSGRRMLNTVNDIIEISRIEAGLITLKPDRFDVNETLKDLLSFFKPEAEKKGVNLYIEQMAPKGNSSLVSDKQKFESILSNLIKNAIKYTNQGEIKTGYLLGDGNIEFYIIDTGTGISESRQIAIFDRFVQADIEDKKALGGSGLGLSISKAYAEAMGGNLWLQKSDKNGSEFRFKLPLGLMKESIKSKPDEKEKLNMPLKNLKVLIVEDDESSYQYLAKLLSRMTDDILWVEDGVKAVEVLRKNNHIDLVLMDMLMPNMNGFEATKQIREFNKEVIIIAQTALVLTTEKEQILASGCNDYISKPVFYEGLRKVISQYF